MKYQDPISGNTVEFKLLPVDELVPVDLNRELSSSHVKKLAESMSAVGYFTTPLVVAFKDGTYYVVDGQHRLQAAKAIGLQEVPCVIINDGILLQRIMKLNTEKANNVRDLAVQAKKIYYKLISIGKGSEVDEVTLMEVSVEHITYVTIGIALEQKPKFSASAYESLLRKIDLPFELSLEEARPLREKRAELLLELDELVDRVVQLKKEQGEDHPFLKKEVVAEINPCRGRRGAVDVPFEEVVEEMKERCEALLR